MARNRQHEMNDAVDALIHKIRLTVDECCLAAFDVMQSSTAKTFPTRQLVQIEEGIARLQVGMDLLRKFRPYVTR